MENVQRIVMLLKPDSHIMGRWDSGAALRLNAVPGGTSLSLKIDGGYRESGTLFLLLKSGGWLSAGETTGASYQTKVSGVSPADIAGAAVIRGNRFLLRSTGPDWASLMTQYRFANNKQSPVPEQTQETTSPQEMANVDEALPVRDTIPPQNEIVDSTESAQPSGEAKAGEAGQPGQAPHRQKEDPCPHGIRQDRIDPFPGSFPGSEWTKISYPGPAGWWHYILGRAFIDGRETDVIGVPGEYGMTPPVWLDGFSTWMRCLSGDARGYWLMFQDVQTGRVLDTGRSRRGG